MTELTSEIIEQPVTPTLVKTKPVAKFQAFFNKTWVLGEIKVAAALFLGFFAVDGIQVLMKLYSGDWSLDVLTAFMAALKTSAGRVILTLIFPNVFKHNTSTTPLATANLEEITSETQPTNSGTPSNPPSQP